jgi:CDP-glycerol glycerophosphotransferase
MPRLKLVTDFKVWMKRSPIKGAGRWFLESFRTLYMIACRAARGIDRDKIVFSCFNARTYGDNLKPISEKLHEMRPQAKIVWMFRNPASKRALVPDYVVLRDPISLAGLREYATARVWVDNFTLPRYLKRRIGSQFYLNTWHGDRAFKKIAYDAFPERRLRIEETCDLMLAGSEFGKRMMRSAFRFEGELLAAGGPRNDILVKNDPSRKAAIREKLGVPERARLLIYCPTFRDSTRLQAFHCPIDLESALDALEKRTGDKWLCLFRAHQLAKGGLDLKGGGRLLDVTGYEDMADLLLASDALVTDYSSAAMDFALTGRPIFLYQDDIDQYVARDRRLYFDIADSPFLAARDMPGLLALIEKTDDPAARENCAAIADFFGFIETGRATERVCERIAQWMKK